MTDAPSIVFGLPRNYLRPSLLLLIAESASHGYELLDGMRELGMDRVDTGAVYRTLRTMEHEGLLTSSWAQASSGPPRRTYELTEDGAVWLSECIDVVARTQAQLVGLLDRYATLERHSGCIRAGASEPRGAGLRRFARYASAPTWLGPCGPADHHRVGKRSAHGPHHDDLDDLEDLDRLVHRFDGPWPYLRVLAAAAHIDDPLDEQVVEAYWIGNDLLDLVPPADLRDAVVMHQAGAPTPSWPDEAAPWAVANHGLQVFAVYPWLDLIPGAHGGYPLIVLDRCRVRGGRVVSTDDAHAVVSSAPVTWDGSRLDLGAEQVERVVVARDRAGSVDRLEAGEWVALHWDWVCERLDTDQVERLDRLTRDQLVAANDRLARRRR